MCLMVEVQRVSTIKHYGHILLLYVEDIYRIVLIHTYGST
jgi:hypothetical protein